MQQNVVKCKQSQKRRLIVGEVIGIGEYATRILKEEGIECGFGVVGFHSEMLYTMFPQYGMPL